ncbi:Arm DNA-binding domain-containing protein [Burkholderia territorii]|uniref:Arm DNA-binding domain-containing protein n=1 Tax=Burkholderia territorii TaxID=1503055 RepID=UPI0039BF82EC
MAGRQLHRLSALRVAKAVDPGHYADGGGLFMQIAGSGARSWVFRFTLDKRVREMGLGPLSRVSLGEARKLATKYREMVRDQIDRGCQDFRVQGRLSNYTEGRTNRST